MTNSIWLGAGAIGLAFGQGHWPSGVMLLAGLVCTATYFMRSNPVAAIILFVIVHVAVWEWAYRGMAPLPPVARIGMEAGVSTCLALCFLFHRWVYNRSRSFWATLALPCALVGFEFGSARLSPGGTWGSLAYTFINDLAIVQVASLFGWTALTFLVGWVAASTCWVVWGGASHRRCFLATSAVGSVLLCIIMYSSVQIANTRDDVDQYAIACIVAPSTFSPDRVNDVWAYTRGVKADDASRERATARIHESLEEHVTATLRAAQHGAEFVLWPEVSASLTTAEYDTWIETVSALASDERIHIGMGLMVFRPIQGLPSINKYVLISPDRTVAIDFIKATRPPGAGHIVGDGVLPSAETPLGMTTAAICFDLDFPQLIRQAGEMGADVLLAPSNDWREAAMTHAAMARMRAIEQGATLVRPTRDGLTVFSDPNGRVLASMYLHDGETGSLQLEIPIRSHPTVYALIGDRFSWLCVTALMLLTAAAIRAKGYA